ncbi:hypothetical protein [Solibacillus merdavium]|uniref:Uncharacterized protein n=1 Tax=Solibacillus merdavium TaxID=2762218 RepID=A0ABR8XMH4_9BACL|nr:hypothetical protein [Solibacillus merdavium]MBD8033135.1 hypothetical protein [Solibacillus merdavium]
MQKSIKPLDKGGFDAFLLIRLYLNAWNNGNNSAYLEIHTKISQNRGRIFPYSPEKLEKVRFFRQ